MAKTLTYGMVGGGPDAFIGDAHRRAIGLDGTAVIAAGVFSRNREKSLQTAEELGISTDRCYEDYRAMARAEGEREDGIDFVVVVTPNQSHYEICRAFLEAGIHVACDKPVTTTYGRQRNWKPGRGKGPSVHGNLYLYGPCDRKIRQGAGGFRRHRGGAHGHGGISPGLACI